MLDAKLSRRAFLGLAATTTLAACGGGGSSEPAGSASSGGDGSAKLTMITDTGGVNDQSFNQLSWAGMKELEADLGWQVSYIESNQEADYVTNLDKAVDDGCNLIWGVGFSMEDAMHEIAEQNPDILFAGIEISNSGNIPNLTGVNFKSQESSFAVGYIAARMSKSGKVGFIGGITSEVIEAFKNGYYGGIEYANKQHGLSVTYEGQYAESFSDAAKGKSIAQKMIQKGADVFYAAAGGTGIGSIEACQEAGVWAIGVDMDQSYLAPDTVITSALKRVDNAIIEVSKQLINGEVQPGGDMVLGAAEDGVGIAETHDLLPDEVYESALEVLELLKAGDIVAPSTDAELKDFIASL